MTGPAICGLRSGVSVLCAVLLVLASPAVDAQLHSPSSGLRAPGSAIGLKWRSVEEGNGGMQRFGGFAGTLPWYGGWQLSYGGSRAWPVPLQDDAPSPPGFHPYGPAFHGTGGFSLQAEGQWGNFRGAYTRFDGQGPALQSRNGHRFRLSYHYTGRSSFGLSYGEGRDFDVFGPQQTLPGTDMRNWSLGGQHWLTPSLALTYSLVNQDPGGYLRRQGLRLGIRHDF